MPYDLIPCVSDSFAFLYQFIVEPCLIQEQQIFAFDELKLLFWGIELHWLQAILFAHFCTRLDVPLLTRRASDVVPDALVRLFYL